MAKQWVRHEIKRNEIAVFLEKIIKFYQNNREPVIAGGGIGLVLVVVFVYFIMQYTSLNVRAWNQLSQAQGLARSGNTDQSTLKLQEIARNIKRTPAAIHSLLFLGEIHNRNKNYEKSAEIYKQIIDSHNNDTLLPFAYVGLGSSLINMGNLDKAVEIYTQYADKYPGHFLYPTVLQSLAYCYEKSGERDEAKTQYEKIVTLYPQTMWAENSYAWLNLLDKGENK